MTLLLPDGYVSPPRASLMAVARTIFVVLFDLVPIALSFLLSSVRDPGSSNTASGLATTRLRYLRVLTRLDCTLEVIGTERVPSDGGVVFLWNQASHFDHLVLPAALPRPFFSLFNNELGAFPLYGAYLRRSGHVHVDRTDVAQWRPAIALAARRVAQGECVLVSPEGTRNWDGKLLPIKQGSLLLAGSAQRPVVCVCVVGGHERLPRGSAVVRPGRVVVEFSNPIAIDGDTAEARADLAAKVAATLQQALDFHGPRCLAPAAAK